MRKMMRDYLKNNDCLRAEGADKKIDYHRALKGAFYVFTRAKRESYTVV